MQQNCKGAAAPSPSVMATTQRIVLAFFMLKLAWRNPDPAHVQELGRGGASKAQIGSSWNSATAVGSYTYRTAEENSSISELEPCGRSRACMEPLKETLVPVLGPQDIELRETVDAKEAMARV
jgi:hypothetical protein